MSELCLNFLIKTYLQINHTLVNNKLEHYVRNYSFSVDHFEYGRVGFVLEANRRVEHRRHWKNSYRCYIHIILQFKGMGGLTFSFLLKITLDLICYRCYIWERVKIARRQNCTRLLNCTRTSCKSVFVQRYLRAFLCPRANLTATHYIQLTLQFN